MSGEKLCAVILVHVSSNLNQDDRSWVLSIIAIRSPETGFASRADPDTLTSILLVALFRGQLSPCEIRYLESFVMRAPNILS
jgi:hypothetical protein